MDDLSHERMVAFSASPPFFAVVVWRVSFLQVLVVEICHPVTQSTNRPLT